MLLDALEADLGDPVFLVGQASKLSLLPKGLPDRNVALERRTGEPLL